MLRTIIFSDEITLWWEKEWQAEEKITYGVFCNGEKLGETQKTHYSFKNLQSETEYLLRVERIGEIRVKTGKQKRRIDVTKAPYNAVGDGVTLNTSALQKALNDCTENDCVYFPAGTYLTGALRLHSNTELYVDTGAILQGSKKIEDYLPKRLNRFEGIEMECYSALLTLGELDHTAGCTCENLVVRGGGVISGGGAALCDAVIAAERERLKDYLTENAEYVKTCENDKTIPGRARPCLVNIRNCKNVVLANVTFQYGAAWNVHFVYSENIVTYGCKIISAGVWNGDGWNPDSSENCAVFDCTFDTGDNSIAVKSGKNPEGNIINRPTKNVYIFDCRGGRCVGIGSEMSGGIENVYMWDCSFTGEFGGISIKVTKKRGGYLRNIRVKDCVFTKINARSVRFNDDGESAPTMPIVEDFYFDGVELLGCYAGQEQEESVCALVVAGLDGEDGAFRNFTFKNLRIHERKDGDRQYFALKNVQNMHVENLSFI